MARSGTYDPLTKFRWRVSIDGFSYLGFVSCGTPSYSITTKEYPEGGAHLNPRQIIDSIKYNPVTLTTGVTNDTSFNVWATGFIDLTTNNAAMKAASVGSVTDFANAASAAVLNVMNSNVKSVPSNDGDLSKYSYRRTVTIEHLDRVGIVIVAYTLYNAFPIDYKPASDFDSRGEDTVSIGSLTLCYEGFDVKYGGAAATAAEIAAQKLVK